MSTNINPRLPFVYPHSVDHPFRRMLEAYYGDLDAMTRNTELALSAGTTAISIPYPQLGGESWAERAANAARSLKPIVRVCTWFYEANCYPPIVINTDGFEVHALYSALSIVPQCLDYQTEHFWLFCERQQVLVSSVLEVRNGDDAQITEMIIEYPNALGGTIDPRWHGIPPRTSPMEYLRWLGKRGSEELYDSVDGG